jgi:hypothetical protein
MTWPAARERDRARPIYGSAPLPLEQRLDPHPAAEASWAVSGMTND